MGRYKVQTTNDEKPRKWEVRYKNADNTDMIWKYNLDIRDNGPVEVEVIYPKQFKSQHEIMEVENNNLPLTKRKYFNEANGKMVGYTRAKNLGII